MSRHGRYYYRKICFALSIFFTIGQSISPGRSSDSGGQQGGESFPAGRGDPDEHVSVRRHHEPQKGSPGTLQELSPQARVPGEVWKEVPGQRRSTPPTSVVIYCTYEVLLLYVYGIYIAHLSYRSYA